LSLQDRGDNALDIHAQVGSNLSGHMYLDRIEIWFIYRLLQKYPIIPTERTPSPPQALQVVLFGRFLLPKTEQMFYYSPSLVFLVHTATFA
jgi:hypothetical protein